MEPIEPPLDPPLQRPFHSPVIVYLQYAKTSEGGMIPVMTSDINVYIEGRRGPQMKECI